MNKPIKTAFNDTTNHSSFGRAFPFGIHHAVFDLCQVTFAHNPGGYAGEKAAQNQAENAQYQDQGTAMRFQTARSGSELGWGDFHDQIGCVERIDD
ncbi:MAG: hypothetical protein OSB55_09640 [Verrucomicrobiota bacterium]|nr:hypothetical protein [Verrucomicrobiota bacterium]